MAVVFIAEFCHNKVTQIRYNNRLYLRSCLKVICHSKQNVNILRNLPCDKFWKQKFHLLKEFQEWALKGLSEENFSEKSFTLLHFWGAEAEKKCIKIFCANKMKPPIFFHADKHKISFFAKDWVIPLICCCRWECRLQQKTKATKNMLNNRFIDSKLGFNRF